MNRSMQILTIASVMNLSVVTIVPAQMIIERAPTVATSVPSSKSPPAATDKSKYEEVYRPRVEATPVQPLATSSSYGRSSRYGRSSSGSVFRGKRQVFIIPAAEIEWEDHLAIEREIHVMSYIFDRVLKKPVSKIGGVFTVMDDFFGRDSHVTQVVYADGYGAMFFMEVDFVLMGVPSAPEAKEPNEPKEQVDTAWKQAERELYGPSDVTMATQSHAEPQYDAEKVELLKRNLVEALKYATNIQALKADELVILTVTGRSVISRTTLYKGKSLTWSFRSGSWVPETPDSWAASYPTLPPSVLSIRVKKSDIDAFAKGELDFNKFYERTQLLTNWSGSAGTTSKSIDSMMR